MHTLLTVSSEFILSGGRELLDPFFHTNPFFHNNPFCALGEFLSTLA